MGGGSEGKQSLGDKGIGDTEPSGLFVHQANPDPDGRTQEDVKSRTQLGARPRLAEDANVL